MKASGCKDAAKWAERANMIATMILGVQRNKADKILVWYEKEIYRRRGYGTGAA